MINKNNFFIIFLIILFFNNLHSANKVKKKMKIQFLHFKDCPNSETLLDNLNLAIEQINKDLEILNIIVDTPELAKKYKFIGSPSILLNGKDIEDMKFPIEPNLSCRFYINGVPSVDFIKNKIQLELNKY